MEPPGVEPGGETCRLLLKRGPSRPKQDRDRAFSACVNRSDNHP
jgi:hypothetical protein